MRDVLRAWLLVAHTYLNGLRRLAQAASAAEGDGEALPLAGAVCGGIRPHERSPAA